MTAKELKKLTRTELLEMLLQQVAENEALRQELDETREALKNRSIVHETSGSIAEAALKINGVFDQAQRAADDYLESLRLANAAPEAYTQKIQKEAMERAEEIIAQAEFRSARIRAEADEYWQMMREKVQSMLEVR